MSANSSVRSLRAAILSAISPRLRARLRGGRDALRFFEARVRARLPRRFGGHIAQAQLHARRLNSADRSAVAQLRAAPEHLASLESTSFFGVGVFVRGELIAVGYCRALGPDQRPFQRALLYAGFVAPRWRLRHVGRVLHRERLAQLRRAGAEEAFAWVEPRNVASLASLRACGFRQVARQGLWGRASDEQLLLRCEVGSGVVRHS